MTGSVCETPPTADSADLPRVGGETHWTEEEIHTCSHRVKDFSIYTCMYILYVHVYTCILAKSVVKEEKKENPDPIHHTRTVQKRKHK